MCCYFEFPSRVVASLKLLTLNFFLLIITIYCSKNFQTLDAKQ